MSAGAVFAAAVTGHAGCAAAGVAAAVRSRGMFWACCILAAGSLLAMALLVAGAR